MVDVDRHMAVLTPAAHAAGLRRLSTRAAIPSASPSAGSSASPSPRAGLLSFDPLAEALLSHLRSLGVPVTPGLSDAELARAEAELAFAFPPDLRALLALGLPSAPGFPDWRQPMLRLRPALDLPLAAVSAQIARGAFWPRSWGPRPAAAGEARRRARAGLRRAPILIPLFDRCYIPCRPSLAGNPIFLIDEHRIACCGFDLADFFRRETAFRSGDLRLRRQLSAGVLPPPTIPSAAAASSRRSLDSIAGKAPRWIEFWSDAAAADRRRRSSAGSSSSSSPPDRKRFLEIRVPDPPAWLGRYLDSIGSVLKEGGWPDSEVAEMVQVTASNGFFDADGEAVLDALLLKADRCSDSLRRAGWSSDEITDVLGFDLRPETRRRRPPLKLPPEIAVKIGKLAEAVSRSSLTPRPAMHLKPKKLV